MLFIAHLNEGENTKPLKAWIVSYNLEDKVKIFENWIGHLVNMLLFCSLNSGDCELSDPQTISYSKYTNHIFSTCYEFPKVAGSILYPLLYLVPFVWCCLWHLKNNILKTLRSAKLKNNNNNNTKSVKMFGLSKWRLD